MTIAWEPLAGAAVAMAVATACLLYWGSEARTVARAGTILFLLGMMVTMLLGGAVAVAPGVSNAVLLGLAVAGLGMAVLAAAVFGGLYRYARPGSGASPAPLVRRGPFAALAVALALTAELLMGWVFAAAYAGTLPTTGAVGGALTAAVDTPWFLFSMGIEMALTTLLLRGRLSLPLRAILLTQAGIMILSPPALASTTWADVAVYGSSIAMIGLFVFLMEHLYRHRQLTRGFSAYLVVLLAVYGAMMAGVFLWQYYGDGTLFAIAAVAEMVAFFEVVLQPGLLSEGDAEPWQLRPNWAFALLSAIFVAELFMGAVLDVQIDPADYLGGFPLVALSGGPGAVLTAAFWNGFWFLATVTASTWFLLMMGVEMGALVVFKMLESKNLENRIRLALMIGCYFAFAVFYPSLYFGLLFPNAPDPSTVPVLGWSMGIGSYPLALGVFGVLLITYIVTGALSVFFGRRVICATFCTAPLMYNGTTLDAMKSFNRSSTFARKYLSSRLSAAYSATTGTVMGALVVTASLSYLDSIGRLSVMIDGTDPSVFLFVLSFSVMWYVLFVSIPYAGNFNCVTMGYCYTGTIAQAFQKIGFFSLKVKDREVCKACTTLDCAKGCPVGLVDMPGHFRKTGTFRSTKCCGVGDCVEDCPYGNLYISDVRHWVRRRLGRPEVEPLRPLPMVRSATSAPRLGATPSAVAAARSEASSAPGL